MMNRCATRLYLLAILYPVKLLLRLKPDSEAYLCVCLTSWLIEETLSNNLQAVWFHVPNESDTGRVTGKALLKKAMGRIPGVPDYIFIGNKQTILIEIKAGKNKMTENQETFKRWCTEFEIPVYLCKSMENVKEVLIKHNFLRK